MGKIERYEYNSTADHEECTWLLDCILYLRAAKTTSAIICHHGFMCWLFTFSASSQYLNHCVCNSWTISNWKVYSITIHGIVLFLTGVFLYMISLAIDEAHFRNLGIYNSLQWHHNERHGVSNHRRLNCLFNCWSRRRSKKTSKLRVTGLGGGIMWWIPCTRPVTRKTFPFGDVIMLLVSLDIIQNAFWNIVSLSR